MSIEKRVLPGWEEGAEWEPGLGERPGGPLQYPQNSALYY
jgi:hypothetical protein